VVAAAAAGYVAPCPHCEAQIRIPRESEMSPHHLRVARNLALNALMVFALTAAGVALMTRGTRNAKAPSEETPVAAAVPDAARPVAGRERSSADAEPVEADTVQMATEVQRLASENQSIRMQFEELGNWVLRNFRGKYPLPERLVPRLRLVPVNEDFTLQSDVAELLQVNPMEKSYVDDALVATHRSLSDLESALMTVTQSAPDKVMLHVPPYAESGAIVREDLYAALEATLGASRLDRFLAVSEEELQKSYHYFGVASRTLIFEVTYPQDERLPPYLIIKDGWIMPQGESGRSMQVTETAVNQLPKQYLAYLGLLPDAVAAYAR
jgi:hypothetical protein